MKLTKFNTVILGQWMNLIAGRIARTVKTCNTSYLVARTAIDPIFPMSPIAPIVLSKTPSHLNLKAI